MLQDNDAFIDLVLQSIDGYEFAALLQHVNQTAGYASDGISYNMNDVNNINNPHYNVVVEDKACLMIVLMGIDKSANTRQKKVLRCAIGVVVVDQTLLFYFFIVTHVAVGKSFIFSIFYSRCSV